jgi:hypothetical protein
MLLPVLWNILAAGMWILVLTGHPTYVFLAIGCNLLSVAATIADCTGGEEDGE